VSVAAAGVLCVALVSGCADDSTDSSGGSSAAAGGSAGSPSFWYVNPLPNTPDWGRSGKLFKDAASAGGYQATLVGPNKIDIPAMVSQIEQAVSSGAKGIITCPLDNAAFKGAIDSAKAKKIVVASIGCVDPDADFSVGTGNTEYGKVAADLIAQQTGGSGHVGILGTDQTTPNQVEQVKGFRDQVKAKYPDMKELVWESDKSDAAVAAQKIPAMLSAYPDMNYIWIIEGAAPGAVPTALKEAGKKPGDVGVLAIDAQATTLKAISDGWIKSTLNQCWFDASDNIAKLMKGVLAGGTKPKSFYAVPVDPVSKDSLPYKGCDKAKVNAVFNGG
jgi:ABC-type sugar transport system substrate-binding protein